MEQILFRAMGSEIFCAVDVTHPHAQARLAQVPAMFEAWEQTLSRFRPDSELSQLNRRGGRVRVSESLWRVAQLARQAEQLSNGLVSPTLLGLLEAAGYDRSFDALDFERASSQVASQCLGRQVVTRCPPAEVLAQWEVDEARPFLTLAPGARLDFGGIAKGWAAAQAARVLGELGPALVDAGGDLVVTAPRADGSAWVLGIEDPGEPERDNPALPLFALFEGATATSGRSFRKWTRDGRPMHHLIDPRTGCPAESDIVTATVIAPEIWQAETAAKTVFLLGSAAGLAWIEARPAFAALVILEDGTVLYGRTMENYIV